VARFLSGLDRLVPRGVLAQVLLRNLGYRLSRSLSHVPATVDVNRLAGDVAIRGQHDHHVGNLVHGAEPTHRDQGRRGEGVVAHVGVHGAIDKHHGGAEKNEN